MRRFFYTIISLVLLISFLSTGCNNISSNDGKNSAVKQQKKMKVTVMLDGAGRGDKSFNDSAVAGVEKSQKEFSDKVNISIVEISKDGSNRSSMLKLQADQKSDLIIAVGFSYADSLRDLIKSYPSIKFAVVDGFVPGLDEKSNLACLSFASEEGSFLMGALAAKTSKTGKIGFLGGMESEIIESFEAGYVSGAKYANSKIEVFREYCGKDISAFRDSEKGKEIAKKQYKDGADVIYHASGSSGLGMFEQANIDKKIAIGVDSDQSLTVPEEIRSQILTSMLKRVDIAVYETIKSALNNQFSGGYKTFSVANGGIDYAVNEYNKDKISAYKDFLEEVKSKILKKEIVVPKRMKEVK